MLEIELLFKTRIIFVPDIVFEEAMHLMVIARFSSLFFDFFGELTDQVKVRH